SAISAERSSPNKKPGRIIPSNESNSTRLARAFRIPNESGYIHLFQSASASWRRPLNAAGGSMS
ncbi:hypothetical protein, partial [Roseiarcus sp.]|uniref:hypothetical protein n=1 Tax=Roseiarcus sp. TaxID=1969460 RepID=UPI003D0A40B8